MPLLETAVTVASTLDTLSGGNVTGAVSNFFGSTASTCGPHLSDEAIELVRKNATVAELSNIQERWQQSNESNKYGKDVRTAPLARVGAWMRYDCRSAGRIRQSIADDMRKLLAKYSALMTATVEQGNEAQPQFVGQAENTSTLRTIREEIAEFLRETQRDVKDVVTSNAGESVRELTQPAAQRIAFESFKNALPEIVVGAALAFVVFKFARG